MSVEETHEFEHSVWPRHPRVDLCDTWTSFARSFFADFDTGGRGSAHVYALQRPK